MVRHIILTLAMMAALPAKAQTYNIVPQPASMVSGEGCYTLPAKGMPSVTQRRDAAMEAEAYRIEVTPKGITVTSSGKAGRYYAQQTLEQMVAGAEDGRLPSVTIDDSPRFGYRGFMLDVVRTYVPIDEIKRMVDIAARLKLNTLHLHLTDDNGWRLEIKRYPKLTEVGAWRVERPELFPGRLNARSSSEKATYGGYYTQKEMRELVSYCAERHITVLPEIEMPAHSAGLLASYPELACPVVNMFIGVFPGIGGKDASIICCAGNERVFQVYQDILDEVMDIFPSKRIHLGGDEANKAMWYKCPLCQDRIREQGLSGSDRISDGEWAGWYNCTAEFTLDLGSVKQVLHATLGGIVHSDICVAAPQRVFVYASTDGTSFTLLRDIATPASQIFHPAAHPYDIQLLDTPTTLRYLKVVALNPGCIPDGLAREGTPTWMYFDELTL